MKTSIIISTIILFSCVVCYSQNDTINQIDKNGLKQGYWIFYGVDMTDKKYPDSSIVSEGHYIDDQKNGIWTLYNTDGSIKLRTDFLNGRPNDAFVRGRGQFGTECKNCDVKKYDSITVRLYHSFSYDSLVDTLISFSVNEDSELEYLDSLASLSEDQRTPLTMNCMNSLNIYIYKLYEGKVCAIRFSDCDQQSKPSKITKECAKKIFEYEWYKPNSNKN